MAETLSRALATRSAHRPAGAAGTPAAGRRSRLRFSHPFAAFWVPLEWLPSRYMAHSLIVALAIVAMEANALGGASSYGQNVGCIDPDVLNPHEVQLEASLGGTPPPATSENLAAFTKLTITHYTVQAGDSLWAIADRQGVSMATIRWANDIYDPDATLRIGQELILPPVSGMLHTVRSGDTLRALANAYDSDLQAIVSVNSLADANSLAVGQQLIIPGGRPVPVVAPNTLVAAGSGGSAGGGAGSGAVARVASSGAVAPRAASGAAVASAPAGTVPKPTSAPVATHELRAGETLAMVAQKFGVKTSTILNNNRIDDDTAMPVGTVLKVPLIDGLVYTMQQGETISEIAAATGASPDAILRSNGISDAKLMQAGQTLVIPNPVGTILTAPAAAAPAAAAAAPARGAALAAPATTVGGAKPAAVAQPLKPPAETAAKVAVNPLGGQAVNIAGQYLGYRYTWGGTQPSTGFDCSGFTYYVYRQAGNYIPRDLWGQVSSGSRVARSDLQAGDLVFFQNTYMPGLSHSGVYIGGGRFIHAGSESSGVLVSNLSDPYWSSRYYAGTRPGR